MTVGDLTRYIREMFEVDYRLQDVWVEGEVSVVSRPPSGHVYFTLKDAACPDCVRDVEKCRADVRRAARPRRADSGARQGQRL